MSIRDVSNLPDDQVPDWVRRSREAKREAEARTCPCCRAHFPSRAELMEHFQATHA
jgi:hypothetical protein